ncbi:restriction endonuclease subunit S [Anabaena azotica]|uniref:restriction endonuclease subunit S n=1 Tax=Anabaena azotica TaxID=197653 RepID=UPI0039A6EC56
MIQADTLKPGWKLVKFGDVVRLSKERAAKSEIESIERYVGLEHIDPEDLRIRRWGLVAEGITFTSKFKPGQVLFGKRRAYQRKVAVADFEGVCSGDIYVFESANQKVLLPELLPFICQTDRFFEYAVGTSAGSLSPRTNWTSLAKFEFVLPPPEKQEKLVTVLISASKSLETLYQLHHSSKILLQSYIDFQINEQLVNIVKIQQLIDQNIIAPPQDGNHGEKHPKGKDFVEIGIPFLMASDVVDGKINFNECKYISEELALSLRIGFAKAGDVLLTHKGTVGETAILNGIKTEFVMLTPQVTYYRIQKEERLLPKYLYLVFRSSFFQRQLASYSRQSTRAYIGIQRQRELQIPLPPLSIQEVAVEKLEQLEHILSSVSKRIDKTQAIFSYLRELITKNKR